MSTAKSLRRIARALERIANTQEAALDTVDPWHQGWASVIDGQPDEVSVDEDGTTAVDDVLNVSYPPSDPNLWDRRSNVTVEIPSADVTAALAKISRARSEALGAAGVR